MSITGRKHSVQLEKILIPIAPIPPRPLIIILSILLFATGCSPFKPTPRIEPVAPLPTQFTMYSANTPDTGEWWESFGNDELNSMVEEALAANFDIQVAWARLRQTRASAIQSGANKYPTLSATGDYSHTRQGKDGTGGQRSITTTEEHSIGLAAGYEIDLWGRISATATSGDMDLLASREDLNTAAMTVAGEVVSRWLEIQSQRRKKVILTEQIKINQTYLELIELRFRNSISTALDVYQQRETVARVAAQLPPVESQEQLLLNELALLMGKPVGSVTVTDADLPELTQLPGLGLPSDILANRPDVRSAGLKLHSADWSVAAARANRLPSLSLSGNAQYSGTQIGTIFNNWMFGLAASVVGPIFDGGYLEAEVEKARGVVDERLATYKNTVYTAFKEVEDALAQEKWQEKYIDARTTQLEASRTSLREAISRYSQGLDTYLPVLTALLSVQDLELSMATDRTNLLLYRVALHRALGGTWTQALQQPATEDEAPTAMKQTSNNG